MSSAMGQTPMTVEPAVCCAGLPTSDSEKRRDTERRRIATRREKVLRRDGAVYSVFFIRGLTWFADKVRRDGLTEQQADAAFNAAEGHSRACVITTRGPRGRGLASEWVKVWLPPSRWWEFTLNDMCRRARPELRQNLNVYYPSRPLATRLRRAMFGTEESDEEEEAGELENAQWTALGDLRNTEPQHIAELVSPAGAGLEDVPEPPRAGSEPPARRPARDRTRVLDVEGDVETSLRLFHEDPATRARLKREMTQRIKETEARERRRAHRGHRSVSEAGASSYFASSIGSSLGELDCDRV
tara:strand:- start:384 stop:1283 length:900 start_codon:yes stop_codon:yes gene_type:complete